MVREADHPLAAAHQDHFREGPIHLVPLRLYPHLQVAHPEALLQAVAAARGGDNFILNIIHDLYILKANLTNQLQIGGP